MIKFLKDAETRELEKHKKAEEEARRKIAEIEKKKQQRMSKVDLIDKKYQKDLLNYQYRCDSFLVQMPAFDRLCWFIATIGQHRKKYSNPEWKNTVKAADLESVEQMINDLAGMGEKPPVKKTLSDDELLSED